MPKSLPVVVSPLMPVVERDGIVVVLVSVEAWPDEVIVHMRGLPSELTTALEREFEEALAAWHRERAFDDEVRQAPPQPAEQTFEFDVTVADDAGTRYDLQNTARGGSRRMFRAEWSFTPGPPAGARFLSVQVGEDEPVLIGINSGD